MHLAHPHMPIYVPQCALGVDLKGDKKEGPPNPRLARPIFPSRVTSLPFAHSSVPLSLSRLLLCSGVSGANAFSRSRDDFWKEGRERRFRVSAVPVQQFFRLLLSHLPLKPFETRKIVLAICISVQAYDKGFATFEVCFLLLQRVSASLVNAR